MGNKIKIFLSIISILIIVLTYTSVSAKANDEVKSSIIRVGIMDNNFKTLERSSVTLYGTSTCYVCDPDTRRTIVKIKEDTDIPFFINQGIIELKMDDCEEIYKSTKGFVVCCPDGFIGVKGLKRRGQQALYRGAFKIQKNTKPNVLYLINIIDLEDYLKGVVSNEMPENFGLEALKAQAIAARNYAIKPRTKVSKAYDVVDSVAS